MGWGDNIRSFGRYFLTLLIITIAGSILQALISGLTKIYIPFSSINSLLDYTSLILGITPESLSLMEEATLAKAGYVSILFFAILTLLSALLTWSDANAKKMPPV